jgi:hypothetical protein
MILEQGHPAGAASVREILHAANLADDEHMYSCAAAPTGAYTSASLI